MTQSKRPRCLTRPVQIAAMVGIGLVLAGPAHAAGSGMPWEGPLDLAFGETSGGMRKLIQIVFGLSIAFAATSFFLTFFSFGGGALI